MDWKDVKKELPEENGEVLIHSKLKRGYLNKVVFFYRFSDGEVCDQFHMHHGRSYVAKFEDNFRFKTTMNGIFKCGQITHWDYVTPPNKEKEKV